MSSPSTGSRGAKAKLTKVITLTLSPSRLAQFPHDTASGQPSTKASTPSESSTSIPIKDSPPSTETIADGKVVTSPKGAVALLQVPKADTKKKGGSTTLKPGTRRSLVQVNGITKQRAKPGPKKRQKLDGTTAHDGTTRPWTTPAPVAGHKLGPKANQGAINAGLRALDRKGKPCRKWEKRVFRIKSFTGIVWEIPTWRAPKKVEVKAEVAPSSTPTSNSETPVQPTSSNIGSDQQPHHLRSSPAPDGATPGSHV